MDWVANLLKLTGKPMAILALSSGAFVFVPEWFGKPDLTANYQLPARVIFAVSAIGVVINSVASGWTALQKNRSNRRRKLERDARLQARNDLLDKQKREDEAEQIEAIRTSSPQERRALARFTREANRIQYFDTDATEIVSLVQLEAITPVDETYLQSQVNYRVNDWAWKILLRHPELVIDDPKDLDQARERIAALPSLPKTE